VAEKNVKTKQLDPNKNTEISKAPVKAEKPAVAVAKAPAKEKKDDKAKTQPKQPNRMVKWYRETIGELRKVTWPTPREAWQLTKVVLIVMLVTSIVLGSLDYVFSKFIGFLVTL
jgi:preprotein translocase subunit SecE